MVNTPSSSERGLPVAPRAPSSAPDATVLAQRADSGASAVALVEDAEQIDATTLPPTIQTEVDELIGQLLAESGETHNRSFRSSPEYRQRAVRAAALLREYLGSMGQITARAGIPTFTLQKYATRDAISLLSDEETAAIERLANDLGSLTVGERIGEEDGKKLLALIRLFRKGQMDQQMSDFRKAHGVTTPRLSRQQTRYRLTLTRDLVPTYFPEPAARDGNGQGDVPPLPDAPSDPADQSTETDAQPVPTETASSAPQGTTVSPDEAKLRIIGQLTAQHEQLGAKLLEFSPDDPRVATIHLLVEQSRGMLLHLGVALPDRQQTAPASPAAEPVSLPMEAPVTEPAVPSVIVPSNELVPATPQVPARLAARPAEMTNDDVGITYTTTTGARVEISKQVRGILVILEGNDGNVQTAHGTNGEA
jgi:hypothetical protein